MIFLYLFLVVYVYKLCLLSRELYYVIGVKMFVETVALPMSAKYVKYLFLAHWIAATFSASVILLFGFPVALISQGREFFHVRSSTEIVQLLYEEEIN